MEQAEASTRLREAIVSRDGSLIKRLLDSNPRLLQNPDFADKSNTSLHLAAQYGHAEIAEYLISLGHDREAIPLDEDYLYSPDVDNLGLSINTDGQCPLHLAAAHSNAAVVQVLCKHFARTVHRVDNDGATPLHLAAAAHATPNRGSSSSASAGGVGTARTPRGADDTSVIEILLAHGADVKAKDNKGNTCLHNATAWGNLKAVRVLMEAGADARCQNWAGWTPESYSITVQAEVYYRNLVAEIEQRRLGAGKAQGHAVHGGQVQVRGPQSQAQAQSRERRALGAGSVRLVSDDDDEDNDNEDEEEEDDGDGDEDDENEDDDNNNDNDSDEDEDESEEAEPSAGASSQGGRGQAGTGQSSATGVGDSDSGLGITIA